MKANDLVRMTDFLTQGAVPTEAHQMAADVSRDGGLAVDDLNGMIRLVFDPLGA